MESLLQQAGGKDGFSKSSWVRAVMLVQGCTHSEELCFTLVDRVLPCLLELEFPSHLALPVLQVLVIRV